VTGRAAHPFDFDLVVIQVGEIEASVHFDFGGRDLRTRDGHRLMGGIAHGVRGPMQNWDRRRYRSREARTAFS
jgi:hypothetical protein